MKCKQKLKTITGLGMNKIIENLDQIQNLVSARQYRIVMK